MNFVKKFLKEEDGVETIEIVVIAGVLLAMALLFKEKIGKFASHLIDSVFSSDNEGNGKYNPLKEEN